MIYFDTETGGVEPKHPTISLAAVAVNGSMDEVGHFDQRISFDESSCDPKALEINHYTREAWADAVAPAVAAARFAAFVRPFSSVQMISQRTGRPYSVAALAGYNALTFDLPRLREMFGTSFFPCSYQVRDVLQRVLFHFDERPSLRKPDNFKLTTIAEYFGIDTSGAHDALTDVRLTVAVHRKVQNETHL